MAAAHTFIEPGSGYEMQIGKFYILSDSGSAYSSTGFDSAESAVDYINGPDFISTYGPDVEVSVPAYDPVKHEWNNDWSEANVLSASDLQDFWVYNPA